jgi:O-antigen/teichoic acid export membrane protein
MWWLWKVRAYVEFPVRGFAATARRLLSYGTRAYGLDVLLKLTYQIDQTFVITFLGAKELGLYVVAVSVARSLNVVGSSLFIVLLPKASGLEPAHAVELVGRATRVTLALALAAAGFIALALPLVLPLLYGRAFDPSIRIAQIVLLDTALLDTSGILMQAFLSTGRPAVVTVMQAAALLTALPLLAALVPRLGVLGAALALLTSTFVRFGFLLTCFPLVLRRRPPGLILTRADVNFVMARIGERSR